MEKYFKKSFQPVGKADVAGVWNVKTGRSTMLGRACKKGSHFTAHLLHSFISC